MLFNIPPTSPLPLSWKERGDVLERGLSPLSLQLLPLPTGKGVRGMGLIWV